MLGQAPIQRPTHAVGHPPAGGEVSQTLVVWPCMCQMIPERAVKSSYSERIVAVSLFANLHAQYPVRFSKSAKTHRPRF